MRGVRAAEGGGGQQLVQMNLGGGCTQQKGGQQLLRVNLCCMAASGHSVGVHMHVQVDASISLLSLSLLNLRVY